MRDRESTSGWGIEAEGEADCSLSREPPAGLNPKMPKSLPEPKADASWLSHPGVPGFLVLTKVPWYCEMQTPEETAEG